MSTPKTTKTIERSFNPLQFLASLGAGGISIMPFAFFQYTHHTGKGLISFSQMGHGTLPLWQEALFYSLEGVMILFALLHFWLSAKFISKLIPWLKTSNYKNIINDPLKNATVLAPFISIGMTFNVFIATVRFFIPAFSENLQSFMLPAFIAWAVLWLALMRMEIKLLSISFAKSFDVNKINFGWLLHPFALGMITVTGAGIAAMSKATMVAHSAAFLTSISFTMGAFLLAVKTTAIFKSHFNASGLPEKQFLPSLLIVVPNITLFAISAFRLIHYLEHNFAMEIHWLAQIVMMLSFAFEIWYLAFGMAMLKPYFKNHFFNKEFHVSQWGLICPFVAFGVLGSFFYKLFVPNPISYAVVIIAIVVAVSAYFTILMKNIKCAKLTQTNENHDCSTSLIPAPTHK